MSATTVAYTSGTFWITDRNGVRRSYRQQVIYNPSFGWVADLQIVGTDETWQPLRSREAVDEQTGREAVHDLLVTLFADDRYVRIDVQGGDAGPLEGDAAIEHLRRRLAIEWEPVKEDTPSGDPWPLFNGIRLAA